MSRRYPHQGGYAVELRCGACRSVAGGLYLDGGELWVELANLAAVPNPTYHRIRTTSMASHPATEQDPGRPTFDAELDAQVDAVLAQVAGDRAAAVGRPQRYRWDAGHFCEPLDAVVDGAAPTVCAAHGHVLAAAAELLAAGVARWRAERRGVHVTLTPLGPPPGTTPRGSMTPE